MIGQKTLRGACGFAIRSAGETSARKDAEADTVIASVLTQHACVPLGSEMERIECMSASRIWRRRQQGVRT